MSTLQAPFPWFGGKSRVAGDVWERIGDVPNYVEPFAGSLAVLLGRPARHRGRVETVNDLDGFIANFWRAVAHDPEQVAHHADWPVNETDLHARHSWLVEHRADLTAQMEGDPDFFDTKVAGWWVWGACSWIGGGWCSGRGPWRVVDGRLVKADLGNAGQGVNRVLPHLGQPRGINRKGVDLAAWFGDLADRLRGVRVASGDWSRVTGESVTTVHGVTGVFLDPPYGDAAGRDMNVYAFDSGTVAGQVREWCIANGANPALRIVLCGYAGEGHDDLADHGWSTQAWSSKGYGAGFGGAADLNRVKERIWYSPACLDLDPDLFGDLA